MAGADAGSNRIRAADPEKEHEWPIRGSAEAELDRPAPPSTPDPPSTGQVEARRIVPAGSTVHEGAIKEQQGPGPKKGTRRALPGGFHKCRQRPTFPLSSIIGGRSLTAVFGMGTGVSSHLWSPTIPAAGFHRRPGHVKNRTSVPDEPAA